MNEDEYTFTITIMVTASSPAQAAEHALEDLRDPEMEWDSWTVRNLTTGEVTMVGGGS
jgi:hypothetical protein